jgi:crotonobetainyl-CoA:carnitine CoA-transferase CaiB-like acyl-CoA transferase
MSKPLAGIRVLDLSRVLAGPWSTQLLADFGADVIKVERPGAGDDTRHWGPPYLKAPEGDGSVSAYFLAANRGKKSIAINFTTPAGQKILRALAAKADVLVENYKVGALAAYGLDYPALSAVNARLVYCAITGYGQDGPYARWPGYDFVLQGVGGLMSITGHPDDQDGEPTKVGVAVVDIMSGLYASSAILAALRGRDISGRGQFIDIGLLDVQVAMLANQAMNYLVSGRSPQRRGNVHPNIAPYESLRAGDGVINVAVGNDAQFRLLCELLDIPAVAADARFGTNGLRVQNREALAPLLESGMKDRPVRELVALLNEKGVPAGAVNLIADVFADPQVRHREIRRSVPHSELGDLPQVACPVKFGATPVTYDVPPPSLGEHTVQILRAELGISDAEISALKADGTL